MNIKSILGVFCVCVLHVYATNASSQDLISAFSVGGTGSDTYFDDVGRSITTDTQGNTLLSGTYSDVADFDPGPGVTNLSPIGFVGSDTFVAKYGPTNNLLFAFGIDSFSDGGIATDSADNILIAGTISWPTVDFDPGPDEFNLINSGGFSASDMFVAKYDSSGNFIFAFNIGGADANNSDYDETAATAITTDSIGNIIVTGYFEGTTDFDPGPGVTNLTSNGREDIFVAKYDSSGNLIFAFSVGSEVFFNNYDKELGTDIAIDSLGNIIVTGMFMGSPDFDPGTGITTLTSGGAGDAFVAKYNVDGDLLFAINISGTAWDQANSLAIDSSDNILITGYFNSTADFDPGPGINNITSNGSSDFFVAKYSPSGSLLFAFGAGSDQPFLGEIGYGITTDAANNILVTGVFSGTFSTTVDFDPGVGETLLVPVGNEDMFVAKYDPTGNFLYAFSVGGSGNGAFEDGVEKAFDITVDKLGVATITGCLWGTNKGTDFEPGPGITKLTSKSGCDFFVARYSTDTTTNLHVLPDTNGDGVSEIGILRVNVGGSKIRLEILNGKDRTSLDVVVWVDNFDEASLTLHVIPDMNDNGVDEVGLFGIQDIANNEGKPQMFVRDLKTGNKVTVYNWVANWTEVSALVLDDMTGDGLSEVAIQGRFKVGNRPQLVVKMGGTNTTLDTYSYPELFIAPQYFQHSDSNGDGFAEISTFGRLRSNNKIQVKIASGVDSKDRLKAYNFPDKWDDVSWHRLDDMNGDGQDDWGLFGTNKLDGRPQLIVKNATDPRGAISIYAWPAQIQNAQFFRIPDMNNDGVDEVAAAGQRSNNDRYQFQVKDGNDRNVVLANHNLNLNLENVSYHVLPDLSGDEQVEIDFIGVNPEGEYELIIQQGDAANGNYATYNLGSDWQSAPSITSLGDTDDDGLPDLLIYGQDTSGEQLLMVDPSSDEQLLMVDPSSDGY